MRGRAIRLGAGVVTALIAALAVAGVPAIAIGASAASGADAASAVPANALTATKAPQSVAEALLARSIAFHDPDGRWGRDLVRLAWNGTGADGEERSLSDITIHPNSDFEMDGSYRGTPLHYSVTGGVVAYELKDAPDSAAAEALEALRLSRDGGMFWRDYYTYLAGLPMKLRDAGTIIEPRVILTEFMGRAVEAIKVTYDPEVGGDTWYFYFDPDSAELVGCRFYHDESLNDGEYIVLEGLIEADGVRIPRKRSWYMNADDEYLGDDTIERLSLGR